MRKMSLHLVLLFCLSAGSLAAQNFGDLKEIARIKKQVFSKRISSYDTTGRNSDRLNIKAGETAEIFKVEGAGVITHIWVTINHRDKLSRRNIILRMYWDGEAEPSVQAPIGDFFGQGWGEFYSYASLSGHWRTDLPDSVYYRLIPRAHEFTHP